METAISLGGGLLVGLGLMFWALWERKKRYQAEADIIRLTAQWKDAQKMAGFNFEQSRKMKFELDRVSQQVNGLTDRLTEAHQRLAKCGDSKAVAEWLDSELKRRDF
jgi:hypothetical protein